MAVIVALVLVGGIVTAVLLLGDDSDDSSEDRDKDDTSQGQDEEGSEEQEDDEASGAEAVADAFVEALEQQDCEAAQATMLEAEECEAIMPPAEAGVTFAEDPQVLEQGETATVGYQASNAAQQTITFTVALRQIDGEWKVESSGQEGQVPDATSEADLSEEASPSQPAYTVAAEFLEAIGDGDCAKVEEMLAVPSPTSCDDLIEEGSTVGDPEPRSEESTMATYVTSVVDAKGDQHHLAVALNVIDGEWKVTDHVEEP